MTHAELEQMVKDGIRHADLAGVYASSAHDQLADTDAMKDAAMSQAHGLAALALFAAATIAEGLMD